MHVSTRVLAALAASTLLLPLSAAGPAAAAGEATPPAARSSADLCAAVPAGTSAFVDADGTFRTDIACVAALAVTKGGPAGLPRDRFAPELEVRRDSMASFLVRLADAADALDVGDRVRALPAAGTAFRDVPAGGTHTSAVERLREAGIVTGGPGGRPADQYGPTQPVTRAQMASFLARTLTYLSGAELRASGDYFTDDENVAVHQAAINALAEQAIAVGDGQDRFAPDAVVRRGQMAGFLARALALLLADGLITPLTATPVQLLALNDFHGALEPPSGSAGTTSTGASPTATALAGGVEFLATQLAQLKAQQDKGNSVTVAAGDLIGASPLLSAAFYDEPTVEALGLAGLQYASVGNHEFDDGSAELLRIQGGGCRDDDCAYREGARYGGAGFQYLSANAFVTATGKPLLAPYAVHEVGGVKVGFIGMTLEGTGAIVSQQGVAGLDFTDEIDTGNRYARELQLQGVETIVVLLHEGGQQTEDAWDINGCKGFTGPVVDIAKGFDDAIDVIASGHTHQAYNCVVDGKLVTSSSVNGKLVTDIDLEVNPFTGDMLRAKAANVVVTRDVARDAAQSELIARYKRLLGPVASEVVGRTQVALSRSTRETLYTRSNGAAVGGDSPLGNVIADAQLAATRKVDAVAAFMNPGGVRANLDAGDVTYEEAFNVQPFTNNLVTLDLTGAQLHCVLEQQFQTEESGAGARVLYVSDSVRYSVSRTGTTAAQGADPCTGSRVVPGSLTIGGVAVSPTATYRVTVNNFLAGGGDGFTTLQQGTNAVTGDVDLDAFTAYLGANSPVGAPTTGRISSTG